MSDAVQDQRQIEVTEADLPLHCPMLRTPLWCYHPRVFLQFSGGGDGAPARAKCPYCGTDYVYRGRPPKGH
jgi:uncharacterized Zn-finger protein